MFIGNNAYNAPIAQSVDGDDSGAAKLLPGGVETIKREFSLMEQEHDRIRTEALAGHVHHARGRQTAALKRGRLESSNL